MQYTYDFPRPSVTLDAAILTVTSNGKLPLTSFPPGNPPPEWGFVEGSDNHIEILLIKRKHDPFAGNYALPGGFLEMDESLETGAKRELQEETGITGLKISPLFVCGNPGRDPRGRTVTAVFGVLIPKYIVNPKGGDDASEAVWFPLLTPPKMAFDHATVLQEIHAHLIWQAKTAVIGKYFLGREFSEKTLIDLHKSILGSEFSDSPLSRGIRLNLIGPGSGKDLWKFLPYATNFQDFSPTVW